MTRASAASPIEVNECGVSSAAGTRASRPASTWGRTVALKIENASGPMNWPARTSVTRTRPASCAAFASRHMRARTSPLGPVAASGWSSVSGPSTGP
ncbi:hypothetical protein [Lentzea indica]|uniref:hypothetical protein n=1 Tax=Lentzea indica TaxID=2604800 RepID=UPI001FE7B9BD|nr:hypothetical protein [Lentzea indica]